MCFELLEMLSPPSVSVIILNYNGMGYVDECLRSVLRTDYTNFEVIFVDNASTDGSLDLVEHRWRRDSPVRLSVLRNEANYGYAKGNNIGARHSRGQYLVFLNVDTRVTSTWIGELVKAMGLNGSLGAAQAKLLSMTMPSRLDTAGHRLTPYGFTEQIGVGDAATHYDKPIEILGAQGAALIVRREIFEKIEGFDEDYFLFCEETDLCWRIWLHGYKILFIPEAVVYHAVGGTFGPNEQTNAALYVYYFQRNMLVTLIKNLELRNVVRILPMRMLLLLVGSLIVDLRGHRAERLTIIFKCLGHLILNISRLWKKRLKVQGMRQIGDAELFRHVMGRASPLETLRTWYNWRGNASKRVAQLARDHRRSTAPRAILLQGQGDSQER
jgi:hypothetical protein